MVDIARRFPAGLDTEWMQCMPPMTRLILRGERSVQAAAQVAWGPEFSELPCRAITQGLRSTLWLGPDEYMLLDSAAAPEAIVAELERAIGAIPHSLVDISHRQFALNISGPHAERLLNGACPLDLDLGEFPVNMCTRTLFAKAEIVLWRTRRDAFHLDVWRSFSGYVTGLLSEIARELYPIRRSGTL